MWVFPPLYRHYEKLSVVSPSYLDIAREAISKSGYVKLEPNTNLYQSTLKAIMETGIRLIVFPEFLFLELCGKKHGTEA